MSTVFWDEGRPFPSVLHVKRGAEIRRYVPERTADVVVSHGAHGPRPRFVGDVWTMHHVCSACGGPVDAGDRFCRHCGARLANNHEKE